MGKHLSVLASFLRLMLKSLYTYIRVYSLFVEHLSIIGKYLSSVVECEVYFEAFTIYITVLKFCSRALYACDF